MLLFQFPALEVSLAGSDRESPRIKQFRWTEIEKGFHVSAILHRGFHREIEESINAGVPTIFYYYLYFKRVRWYWDNQVISKSEYKHVVTYDTLRKMYSVTYQRSGENEPYFIESTDDPAKMRTLMSTFNGNIEVPPDTIKAGKQYYLSLEAIMHTDKIPPPWDKILFFISHDFETGTSRQWLPVRN